MNQRILLFIVLIFTLQACNPGASKYIANNGAIYGTYYSIKYESPDGNNLQTDIDEELQRLSHIFSHYDKEATITKINNNTPVETELEFITCFSRATEIAELTNGAFDITAGPLISAWGFGPEDRQKMTDKKVDSLKQFCGYEKIRLENGKIIKDNPHMTINMSAIAKGYTCDLIGEFLQNKGCQNYMVDIGGEVVAKGINDKGKIWTIGIREPIENPFENELSAALMLKNRAMATSGNYLNFYEEDGKKYAHTIDPISGYPVQHSLLSASVVANDCMTADAFATAFMVLGKDKSIEIARQVPGMEIYFIYADDNGENQVYMSQGFDKMLRK
ncbi:FAD:protein FMN transferase [Draconibacterium halophilum]|uniref:FAD:protein FMN transferase n=1 Tax=Draconibacterium halophilum TaxID=2706887 RepID=A0A6C0REP9_9BACT|nr:FAD:protein FMN transferase [Draconibacterium halophilum]QIA08870.1 FAD:protein FMN transferase [Draconibacterium halophilum]